jgi:hypothetical protein
MPERRGDMTPKTLSASSHFARFKAFKNWYKHQIKQGVNAGKTVLSRIE